MRLRLAIGITLLATTTACSDSGQSPDTTQPISPPDTTATTTTVTPTTTTLPATTTTAAPTTTTAAPYDDGPPPPVTATMADPENPDVDEVTAVVEQLWAHYVWWLANPHESLDRFVEPESNAELVLTNLQSELLQQDAHIRTGFELVGMVRTDWAGADGLVATFPEVQRTAASEIVNNVSGESTFVHGPGEGDGFISWTVLQQEDGTFRLAIWSATSPEDRY